MIDKDVPVRRCFYIFSLRQGTMLIGIVILLLTGFCLGLLLLGSAQAHKMAAKLEADIEDSAEREGIVLSEETEPHSQNDIVLHKAHNLAFLVIVGMYIGIALATIHFVFCVLLLYGAVMTLGLWSIYFKLFCDDYVGARSMDPVIVTTCCPVGKLLCCTPFSSRRRKADKPFHIPTGTMRD